MLSLQYFDNEIVCESGEEVPHRLRSIDVGHLRRIFERERCDSQAAIKTLLDFIKQPSAPSLTETSAAIEMILEVVQDKAIEKKS